MAAIMPVGEDMEAYSGGGLLPSAIAMAVLATSAVLMRFVSRRITRVQIMWDDWLILAALPFSLLECAIDIEGNFFNHFGRHLQTATPQEYRNFFVTTYVFQLSYGFAVTLPKFSMLALYKRVFGLENFKWPLYITTAVCFAYMIGIALSAMLVCIPISAFWDPTVKGHCIPLLPFYIGQASTNIALDLLLLVIPIIPIRRLNITTSQKIAVCGIFFLGIFVTVCSAVRLNALVVTVTNPTSSMDPTYYFVNPAVWSVVETNLSVVCACLPSMRPLLRAALHGTFKSSVSRSDTQPSHLASNKRASGLVRTMSNRKSFTERPGAAPTKWSSERVVSLERPVKSHNTKSAVERAQKWQRQNSIRGPSLKTHYEDKVPLAPLAPVHPAPQQQSSAAGKKSSGWRPNCPHINAAIDAVASHTHHHERHGSRSSWKQLGRDGSPMNAEDLPHRRDSVTVHSSMIYTGADEEERAIGLGYSCQIRAGGGAESETSSEDWKDKELEAGEWDRARRLQRPAKDKSRGRQVWEDWSRRGSRE